MRSSLGPFHFPGGRELEASVQCKMAEPNYEREWQNGESEKEVVWRRRRSAFVQTNLSYLSQGFDMFFHVSCEGLPGQ